MSGQGDSGGGLSVQTLVIASLSSLAAAIFIHEFWPGGAILGAAVTPVIVALVSEALRKPAEAIKTRRNGTAVNPPPVVTEREDRFGIWERQRPRRRLHVGLAIVTGLVAFAIAAFSLTGAELVLGGASDSDRFRVLPGKQERGEPKRERERQTAPPEEDAPAPTVPSEEEDEQPQTEPPATEPPAPATPETAPPETVPAPDPGATAPTP